MPPASAPVRSSPHIVDVLIAERAPRLYGRRGYGQARRMANAIASMSGNKARRPFTGRALVIEPDAVFA